MHWNKSVFHNFYQQGHDSGAHKNEKGRIVQKPYLLVVTIWKFALVSQPRLQPLSKKGNYKPKLKFNFKSPAAKTFGSLSKPGFGSWASKANKLRKNRKNAKLRKEFGEQYSGLFRF